MQVQFHIAQGRLAAANMETGMEQPGFNRLLHDDGESPSGTIGFLRLALQEPSFLVDLLQADSPE